MGNHIQEAYREQRDQFQSNGQAKPPMAGTGRCQLHAFIQSARYVAIPEGRTILRQRVLWFKLEDI